MSWPNGTQNFGVNHAPLLSGLDSLTGTIEVSIAVDKTTGAVITSSDLGLLPIAYDYVGFSNADGNGNYQTIVYKVGGSGGTTINTLTLTYDGSSNVTSITRT